MKSYHLIFYSIITFGYSQSLLISEYIEGSAYNKAIEIYNPFESDIELTGYQIWKVTNSEGGWTDELGNGSYALDLSGLIIPAQDVIVLCHNSIDSDFLHKCNVTDGTTLNFNGDDAIGLAYNGELIDVIGANNGDPGAGYEVAGSSNGTKDNTLIRKITVTSGNWGNWKTSAGTNMENSEWNVLDRDTFLNTLLRVITEINESE
jgi:predicted extracellular nuclease